MKTILSGIKIILVLILSASAFGQCGVERTQTKDLKDDISAIHFTAKPMTVAALRKIPAPAKWGNSIPRLDSEKQVYEVDAQIIGYKYESTGDRDYHVVLSTVGKPSETMILEIPHPDCAPKAYKEIFANLRAFIDGLGPHPTPKFVTLKVPVHVKATGVAFFDKLHGQTGVAPSGIELHPALSLKKE
jgi:hypothetical protein